MRKRILDWMTRHHLNGPVFDWTYFALLGVFIVASLVLAVTSFIRLALYLR